MTTIESDQCLSHGLPDSDDLEVSLFGPGFGECLAVHLPGGKWVLVDSCRNSRGEPIALAYLQAMGVDVARDVTLVVASHWHLDHVDGIADVVRECRAAEPVISAALYVRDLFAYAGAVQYLGSTAPRAIRELRRLADIVKDDNPGRVITLTQARTTLLRYAHKGISTSVEALSPSPSSVSAAVSSLARTKLVPGQELATPRADYNAAALALRIISGSIGVLLASDLEISFDSSRWRGVVNVCDNAKACDLIKIAHHGSSNADDAIIWSKLMAASPVGLVTHFHNGSVHLPEVSRLQMIADRCEALFSTSGPAWQPTLTSADAVAKMLDRGESIAAIPVGMGHVRARVKPSEAPAWRV